MKIMSDRPLISVIMPVRNGARTLGRAIQSALDQKEADFELIAVDDRSEDESLSLLREYEEKDPRIHAIAGEGGGVSNARNAALNISRGKYVAFLDSDDAAQDTWLLDLREALESSGADMSICGIVFDMPTKGSRFYQEYGDSLIGAEDAARGILTHRDYISSLWNKLLVREIIERDAAIRFDEKITIGEDLVFLCEYLARCERVKTVSGSQYIYTDGSDSAMGQIMRAKSFDKAWLSEWDAINMGAEVLERRWPHFAETDVKKVRVAGKMLRYMRKYSAGGLGTLKSEFRSCLKAHKKLILCTGEYPVAMKVRMIRDMIFP